VPVESEHRKRLKGARGVHADPNAVDIVDLDAIDDRSGARYVGPDNVDPVAQANITPFDRGPPRKIAVAGPSL
jgi:hypothetical protein